MNATEFIEHVRAMRRHQTDYFKGRKQSDLIAAKAEEKIVDRALAEGITVSVATLEDRPDDAEPGEQLGMFE